jgi:acyl-CoA thioester hydrolase
VRFEHQFIVPKTDIDDQGHVNNVAFVRYVQDVAVAHWFEVTNQEQQEKFAWVMLRHEIDYKKQAFEGEELTAKTWVMDWTGITCERFVEIYRGQDLLVKSRTIWCLLDRPTFRPKRIPAELKALFETE